MLSQAVLASLLAAGAFAAPSVNHHAHLHHEKRDAVTVYDTAYVTQYTTVTAGSEPSSAPAPPPGPPNQHRHKVNAQGYGNKAAHYGGWPEQGGQPKVVYWTTTFTQGYSQPSQQPEQYSQPAPSPSPSPEPQPSPSPSPAPAPAPQSSPAPAPQPQLSGYQGNIINSHNPHRSNHSASPLQWHDGLANAAMLLAQTCNWGHNTDLGKDSCGFNGYGQNLAAGVSTDDVSSAVSNMWYNGEEPAFAGNYGQANPTAGFESWGHFTQMVWKGTTHVGCYTQDCSGGVSGADVNPPYLTVCNYGPPGNVEGEYDQNVGQPLGQPTVSGTSSGSSPGGYKK